MGFGAPLLLLGLAALAIPPIIHLLNRRRYEVVDWGAMRFLQISEVTRRRILIEEILLMLLRIGLLAVFVLGLASPFAPADWLPVTITRPNRDVVLLIDGSYSMGARTTGKSAHEAAKEWALAFLSDMQAGDNVAVLQAKQRVIPIVGGLSADLDGVRDQIRQLPEPSGGCDWPAAMQAAHALLKDSTRPERDIIVLGDGQRETWADDNTVLRWNLLATQLGYKKDESDPTKPRLWVVNVDPERPADVRNWSLTPLRGNRPVTPINREVTFRTDIVLSGQTEYTPPHRLRLEVDGQFVRNLEPPRSALGPGEETKPHHGGKVPLSFTHRFAKPGSHLVTLILEADTPEEDRKPGYVLKDQVPGDNRVDYALDVVSALPVLIVDGDSTLSLLRRGSDFLRDALSPARDRTPVVQAQVVSITAFEPALLTGEAASRPRVLILHNVARLNTPQQRALEQYLADGGGVLVTLGQRVDAEEYNQKLFHEGQSWLPARLDGIAGDETMPREAVHPVPAASTHPALELFREAPTGGLGDARFPRWWKLTTPGQNASGVPVASLRSATAEYPFLVERSFRAGRVLVCSVPLDNTWGTNLPDLPAFVPLAHELVYYLAGTRATEFNLQPGQPLRWRVETDAPLDGYTLQPPTGPAKPLTMGTPRSDAYPAQLIRQPHGALLVIEGTHETGVYRLTTPEQTTIHYVVQSDARESDLTPCSDEDRKRVAELLPLQYENDRARIAAALKTTRTKQDLWWLLLVGVIVLLCAEVVLTRWMVKDR
jgi:von Willebrand factor type A domain/Aerotolerance regulator N-terminal